MRNYSSRPKTLTIGTEIYIPSIELTKWQYLLYNHHMSDSTPNWVRRWLAHFAAEDLYELLRTINTIVYTGEDGTESSALELATLICRTYDREVELVDFNSSIRYLHTETCGTLEELCNSTDDVFWKKIYQLFDKQVQKETKRKKRK